MFSSSQLGIYLHQDAIATMQYLYESQLQILQYFKCAASVSPPLTCSELQMQECNITYHCKFPAVFIQQPASHLHVLSRYCHNAIFHMCRFILAAMSFQTVASAA